MVGVWWGGTASRVSWPVGCGGSLRWFDGRGAIFSDRWGGLLVRGGRRDGLRDEVRANLGGGAFIGAAPIGGDRGAIEAVRFFFRL